MSTRRRLVAAVAAGFVLVACSGSDDGTGGPATDPDPATDPGPATTSADGEPAEPTSGGVGGADPAVNAEAALAEPRPRFRYPPAPPSPEPGLVAAEADAAIDRILDGIELGFFDAGGATLLGEHGDIRHAWYVSDLLRFVNGVDALQLLGTFEELTGVDATDDPDSLVSPWLSVTNHLIAWDTPAYEGYVDDKAGIFVLLEPGWAPFFDDADAAIDWRLITWGGVPIDDRELGDPDPCPGGCIPALDDFATTDAAGGAWYPDERIVFGVEVDGDAVAIPLHIAEIHEMFNFTLGGRRIGLPYCTLCGSAQAYFTDRADGSPTAGAAEVPVLRTSGLLSRSNKVMYDLRTDSVFDTFTGDAVSGPLHDAGVRLEELTVVRSSWAEWKAQHPDTRIVAEDGGVGRGYDLDPLGDRDADGPIFPIGDADERLDVQELVVGVLPADGVAVAFPSEAASAALAAGGAVQLAGVRLIGSGDGLVAVDAETNEPIAAHEAFWFAWSQFHPGTELWLPG